MKRLNFWDIGIGIMGAAVFGAVVTILALLFTAPAHSAPITSYPMASTLMGPETAIGNQGTTTVQISMTQIKTFVQTAIGYPCGSTTQVLFNNAGACGASPNITVTGEPLVPATWGFNLNSVNPDVVNNQNNTYGFNLSEVSDASNTAPTFSDNYAVNVEMQAFNAEGVNSNATVAKITSSAGVFTLSAPGSGQNIALNTAAIAAGMGDAFSFGLQDYFGGGTNPGDEGKGLWPVARVAQFALVPGSTVTSNVDYPCNEVLTQAVVASRLPQTITATGTCSGPWATADFSAPNTLMNEGPVHVLATASGSVTGIFRVSMPLTSFTASQVGNVLTVSAIASSGIMVSGQSVQGAGVPSGETIVNFISSTGGTGTLLVSKSASISSEAMTSAGVLSDAWLVTLPGCGGNPFWYCGQDRVWIDTSQPGYSTGTTTSIVGQTVTGSGTTWTPTAAGGEIRRPGCFRSTADDYTGPSFNGTSVDYYEIKQVASNTSETIYRLDIAGNQSYSGLGTGGGSYAEFPCGRSILVGGTNAGNPLNASQILMDYAPYLVAGDTFIEPNSPFPDMTGTNVLCQIWSAGATARSCGMTATNEGRLPFQTGFKVDGSAFQGLLSSPYYYGFGNGYECIDTTTCISSSGDGAFALASVYGASGIAFEIQNTNGANTQTGISLFGFGGPDLILGDTRAGSGHICLQGDTSGVVSSTGGACASMGGGANTGGLKIDTLTATSAAPTVTAGQIGYGSTVAASGSCGTLSGAAGCVVINVAGTVHYVPYY